MNREKSTLSWERICLQCRRHRRWRFDPWVRTTLLRMARQPTPPLARRIPWTRTWQVTVHWGTNSWILSSNWITVRRFLSIKGILNATNIYFGFLHTLGFPHSSVGKDSACNAGVPGSIPWAFLVIHLINNSPALCETWV